MSGNYTVITVFARSDLVEARRFLVTQLLCVDVVVPQPVLRTPEIPQ